MRQILWGLFKKVVIADNCAEYANLIFNNYQDDFDLGAERDAGYVYGPLRPRTYFAGLKFGLN